jgi:chemotaxis signal transduction protein
MWDGLQAATGHLLPPLVINGRFALCRRLARGRRIARCKDPDDRGPERTYRDIALQKALSLKGVTQYRGQILSLIRLNVVMEGHKLRDAQGGPASGSSPLQVLVLNHEGRNFGLVVAKILDIVEDWADPKSAATRASVLYSVVIGERVTELLDIPAILTTATVMPAPRLDAAMHAIEGAH